MGGQGRWDRSVLKKIPLAERLQVEGMLKRGDSGSKIAKHMGFPKSTWVSAVKKNPYPGGVLDKKGELAKYEGDWVDGDGNVRPWLGLTKMGEPVVVDKKKQSATVKGKTVSVLPFVTGPSPGPAPAPTVPHAGVGAEKPDLGEPVADRTASTKGRSRTKAVLKEMRRLSKRLLPIDERMKLMAAHARSDDAGISLKAIQFFNEIDGIVQATKEPAANALGSAPLFALPKGARPGLSPVMEEDQAPAPSVSERTDPPPEE